MSKESHLPPFRIRPRFQVELPMCTEDISKKIKQCLADENAKCTGVTMPGFAKLKIPREDRHYWSPQLSISVEKKEDEVGCTLYGLYGPAPTVWTMFVFFYVIIGFALLAVSIMGYTNYTLGRPSGILWLVPVLLAVLLSVFLVSYFGQRLGHDQMERLHNFLEDCLGREIDAAEHVG
ncbi:MAG TPA: hypothetical protein ENJ95_02555 [Bacteroidetes bacterium]|nr:hypothetical protein [Bacteroidota bacterium]